MTVAAIALLLASGRADFSENEVLAEVERLRAELRSRYGFSAEHRDAALELYLQVRPILRRQLPPSTYRLWVKPLRPVGLAGGRLWLTGPAGVVTWAERRYSGFITEAIAAAGAGDVTAAFLGLEDGRS